MRLCKLACLVLTVSVLLSVLGCSSDQNSSTEQSSDDKNTSSSVNSTVSETVESELGKYDINAVVYNGFDKITDVVDSNVRDTEIDLGIAKNETESVHISFFSDKDNTDVELVVDGQYDGITVSKFLEHYVPCGDTLYPDPIVPFDEKPLTLLPGNQVAFLIEFETTAETAAGVKAYKFRLQSNGVKVSNDVTVNVTVWDFELPQTPSSRSAVWINKQCLSQYTSDYSDETYIEYCEMLLDHGLSVYDLPYDILDSRADRYMSDPRVTSFRVPCVSVDDTTLVAYYNKLKTNPEWLQKAYFYPVDEPTTVDQLNRLLSHCERLKQLCPEIKVVCPYYKNIDVNENCDQTQFLLDCVEVPCPKPCMWDDETIYSESQAEKYPSFKSRMDEHTKNGGELWWYVCNTPGQPYLNLFVDENGLDHRVLFWQQYRYGVDGFLYWCANHWKNVDDPWTDVDTKTLSYPVYGEGILLYPGEKVGLDGPVASLRLKAVRDGIEDYSLFALAEQLLGRDYVLKKINSATPKLTEISVDSNGFSSLRHEIGNDVEKHLKANK